MEATAALLETVVNQSEVERPRTKTIGIFHNPSDVGVIIRLSTAVICLSVLFLTSLVFNAYQYLRRPDGIYIVVSKTQRLDAQGHVLSTDEKLESINNRQYGVATNADVRVAPDQPDDVAKKYLAAEYIAEFCQIDPRMMPDGKKSYRQLALERMFRMMLPNSAREFASYLQSNRVLETEARESWQATWTDWQRNVDLDSKDPYTVLIQGRQIIAKVVAGQSVQETRRIQFTVKLTVDKEGRTRNNLMTGLQVMACQQKVISE